MSARLISISALKSLDSGHTDFKAESFILPMRRLGLRKFSALIYNTFVIQLLRGGTRIHPRLEASISTASWGGPYSVAGTCPGTWHWTHSPGWRWHGPGWEVRLSHQGHNLVTWL